MAEKTKKNVPAGEFGLPYYPYRFAPPELEGTRYLDLCPEFLGEDQMFAGIPTHREEDGGEDSGYEY